MIEENQQSRDLVLWKTKYFEDWKRKKIGPIINIKNFLKKEVTKEIRDSRNKFRHKIYWEMDKFLRKYSLP